MPGSKTDTAMRFPESADQQRRLRNVTQDQKARARAQEEASSGKQKAQASMESTIMSPNQLLAEHMDATGQPVPDAYSNSGETKNSDDDPDVFEAMTADFD